MKSFIYGYNVNENAVYVADNILIGKYIKTEITFDELEKGYWNLKTEDDYFFNIDLFKRKKDNELSFDSSQFITNIKSYMYSTKSIDM